MVRKTINFGEKRTTKKEFYIDDNKKVLNINDININEILISKGLFSEILKFIEYVIGCKNNHNIKLLYIKFPEYDCSGKKIEPYLLSLTMLIFF